MASLTLTTPCHVCKTEAITRGSAFFASRGVDWPVTTVAGYTVHLACRSHAEHTVEVATDGSLEISATGIGRWTSNNHVIPGDSAAMLEAFGVAPGLDVAATAAANEKETAAFLASYRAAAPRQYDAETLHEMRNAFGEGATVVDVISGQTIQL